MKKDCSTPNAFIAASVRYAFAILFILVAVKKFRMGYPGFAESLVNADTHMAKEIPTMVLYAYGYALPALELAAGVMLLFNRTVLIGYQLIVSIYLTFVFGQMYNGNTAKIGTEYFPSLALIAMGYYTQYQLNKGKA